MASALTHDHLFVSFSPQDWGLAEWLTLRLTREGYRVWCSRFPVLGGERYPRNPEDALTTRGFRVLALISRASLANPNTTAEWTRAVALGRTRGHQVLIPLLIDTLDEAERDWTMEVAPISFVERWETGLGRLLAALGAVDAPRPLPDGERVETEARQFMASRRSWHTVL